LLASGEVDPACQSEWFPLHTGNYWVYRQNTRFATGLFSTVRVIGPYEIGSQVYCQIETNSRPSFLRVDAQGRIFSRTLMMPETLLLDPQTANGNTATQQSGSGLMPTETTFARHLGPTQSNTRLATGSSGGLTESLNLVEARIDGKLQFRPLSAPAIEAVIAPEDSNCAIPCYYAACGIGSPVDPGPKTCRTTRLAVNQAPVNSRIQLLLRRESNALTLHQIELSIAHADEVLYYSLPLYSQTTAGAPITPMPPGAYELEVRFFSPAGDTLARQTQTLTVRP
jgi:hypothetical protein